MQYLSYDQFGHPFGYLLDSSALPGEMGSLCPQQLRYDALTKQIHLVQAGLYQPKRKGIGKAQHTMCQWTGSPPSRWFPTSYHSQDEHAKHVTVAAV